MNSINRVAHRNLMVVDDDIVIRNVVNEIFTGLDFNVATACGAGECLRHLRNGFRGIILMDVTMPEMSGWDTIRAIGEARLLDGNIIAMLTGQESPDERMEGLQEVVIDYIRKPFEPKELIAAVRRYCEFLDQSKTDVEE